MAGWNFTGKDRTEEPGLAFEKLPGDSFHLPKVYMPFIQTKE